MSIIRHCTHAESYEHYHIDRVTHIRYCDRCGRPVTPRRQPDATGRDNVIKYPIPFRDLNITYKDKIYWGYYEGLGIWRVGTSRDGLNDERIDYIPPWKYLEE